MSGYGVVLFYTTSAAMRAEKVTKKAGLDVKLVPTPRQLSSDCGIALRFNREEGDDVRSVLAKARVAHDGLHKI